MSCSTEQLDTLLDFLNNHKDLARGLLRTSEGRARSKRLWEQITEILNSLGGSLKSVQQWQKVWTDRKYTAKKNAAMIRKSNTGTGGGPPAPSLSSWELRVYQIMGAGFGEPQTTARVSVFPNINFEQEIATYSISSLLPPQLAASTSAAPNHEAMQNANLSNTLTLQQTEIETVSNTPENVEDLQPPQESPSVSQPHEALNQRAQVVGTRRRHHRMTIQDKLIKLDEEKIKELKGIKNELSGIKSAINEFIEIYKQNNSI